MKKEQTKGQAARLWGKFFILACAGALFYNFAMQILNSNLSLFANDTWGSKSLGGLLTTVFNVGSIAMAFFSGRLADAQGRRRCLVLGSLLFGLPALACALWPTPAVSLASRFVQGIGKGMIAVASSSIVADVVDSSRLAEGMGYYNLANTLAMAFGPMMGLLIVDFGGYPSMFVACAVLIFLTGATGVFTTYEREDSFREVFTQRQFSAKSKGDTGSYRGIWKMIERKALPASLNYTVFFASNCCILVFITVYSREILNLPSGQISMFYMAAAAAMFVTRFCLGKVADQRSAMWAIVPGHIASALSLVLLAFFVNNNYALYLAAGALYGVSQAAVLPAMNAVAVVDSPSSRSGAANATFYCLMDVGIMVGSAAFGAVIDMAATPAAGYRNVYLISLAVCAVSLLMSAALFTNAARERRRQAA